VFVNVALSARWQPSSATAYWCQMLPLMPHTHTHKNANTNTHIHTRKHTHTHTHIRTHATTHTHTHTHNAVDKQGKKENDIHDGQRCPSQRRLLSNAPCEVATVNHHSQQKQRHLAQLCGDDACVLCDRLLGRLDALVYERHRVVAVGGATWVVCVCVCVCMYVCLWMCDVMCVCVGGGGGGS
jgi:hypothetical protein